MRRKQPLWVDYDVELIGQVIVAAVIAAGGSLFLWWAINHLRLVYIQ